MGFDFRMPNITGNDREQLAQIKSYLYQFIPQLQWALNTLNSPSASNYVVTQTPRSLAPASSYGVSQASAIALTAEDSSEDAEATFAAIKPLIIKSADIVEAYYEEISARLEEMYVAESDFGTYTEETEQAISANSAEIEQAFTDIQQIITDIENINFTLAETNAHIRSGILYYDDNGIPVYGLEIGQQNTVDGEEVFNKYARFTSDRLSFYDQNDTEVAYISDYKIYITHAEFTGTVKFGAFRLDTTKGFTLKWVGRG